MKSFNKSFASFYRHLSSVNVELLLPLFFTFSSCFYGSELWADRSKCIASFTQLGVSYHAALKKILGVPRFYSNHLTCSALNTFTLENIMYLKLLRFLFWLKKCKSPCFLFRIGFIS